MQSKALVGSGVLEGQKLILAKPQTFMNLSGQAVGGLMRFYKVPLEQLIIAHDDLDLPFGRIRIRPRGGAGGHRGILSILEALGEGGFYRIRIGIGRPTSGVGMFFSSKETTLTRLRGLPIRRRPSAGR